MCFQGIREIRMPLDIGQDVTGVVGWYRPASQLQKNTSCIYISGFRLRHPEIKCSRNKGIQHTKFTKEITGRRKYSNDKKKKIERHFCNSTKRIKGIWQVKKLRRTWLDEDLQQLQFQWQAQKCKHRACELKTMMWWFTVQPCVCVLTSHCRRCSSVLESSVRDPWMLHWVPTVTD